VRRTSKPKRWPIALATPWRSTKTTPKAIASCARSAAQSSIPDDAKFCSQCGARLASVEDEGERTDETEGRVIGRDDSNDLGSGQPRFRGHREPLITVKSYPGKADEAVREFGKQYQRTRESQGVVRSPITGA
jgi:hypothetical protein